MGNGRSDAACRQAAGAGKDIRLHHRRVVRRGIGQPISSIACYERGGDKVGANIVKSYRHGDAIIHIASDSYDGKSKREIDEIYLNACRVACRIARNAQMTARGPA